MAAFWALLNNVIEIRTDAFKMCRIFQRPFAQPANSIGAWQVRFWCDLFVSQWGFKKEYFLSSSSLTSNLAILKISCCESKA